MGANQVGLPEGFQIEQPAIPEGFQVESAIPKGFEIEHAKPKRTSVLKQGYDLAEKGAEIAVNTLAGVAETAGNLATGMVALPVQGLGNIAGLIAKGNLDDALKEGEAWADYVTYKPSTKFGQIYSQAAGKLLGIPSEMIREHVGGWATDVWGPAMATMITTPLEAAVYAVLFKRAGKMLPKSIDPAAIKPADLARADKMVDDYYKQFEPKPLGDEYQFVYKQLKDELEYSRKARLPEDWQEAGKIVDNKGRPYIFPEKEVPAIERTLGEKAPLPTQEKGAVRSPLPEGYDVETGYGVPVKGTPLITREPTIEKAPSPRTPADLMKEPPKPKPRDPAIDALLLEARRVLGDEAGFIDVEALVGTGKKVFEHVAEFFSPFYRIPDSGKLLNARYKMFGTLDRSERFIKRMFDNLGKFDDNTRGDIFRYLDGQLPKDSLPFEAQEYSNAIKTATTQIGKSLVKHDIITQEQFDNLKGRYVHYMYAKHILGDDHPVGVSPTGKIDLSIAKHRKDLTVDQRKALGWVEDAQMAAPVGLGKALVDLARVEYLEKVAGNPDWAWTPSVVEVPLDPNRPTRMGLGKLNRELETYRRMMKESPSPEVERRFTILNDAMETAKQQTGNIPKDFVPLSGAGYGPLDGAYVRKGIAADITPLMQSWANKPELSTMLKTALDVEMQAMAVFKVSKTALNVPTMFRNIISNVLQNNLRGRNLPQILLEDIPGALNSYIKNDQITKEARKYGIFKTSWAASEVKDILNQFAKNKTGKFGDLVEIAKNVAQYYGRIDDFFKLAIYRQLRMEGQPIEVATLEAQKWGMDYSYASRSIKHARNFLVPFITYQYKIAPLLAESIARRPWVIAKYALIPYIAKELVMGMNDMTDEDWAKLQKQLPYYVRDHKSNLVMPWKSDKGNYQLVNYSYFMPWGNAQQLLESAKQKDVGEMLKNIGINPIIQWPAMVMSGRGNRPPTNPYTGYEIYNRLDPPNIKAAKYFYALATTFMPPMLTAEGATGYTYRAAVGDKDKWGREVTGPQALGRWFGINTFEVSPKQTKVILKSEAKDIRTNLFKVMTDPSISADRKKAYREEARKQLKELRE